MKRKQLQSFQSDTIPHVEMIQRQVEIVAETLDPKTKQVDAVIASENPVGRWDEERQVWLKEVLLMSGIVYRNDKQRLPIVDSHDRSTTRNVLGSLRNLRVEGTEFVGRTHWASDTESQIAADKVVDGHITDFSITATPLEQLFIPAGETFETSDQVIEGPANIVTRWMPTDGSLVATGADETSTVRALRRLYNLDPDNEGIARMDMLSQEQRAALIEKGMPADLESDQDIMNWLVGRMDGEHEGEVVVENMDDEEHVEHDEYEEQDKTERSFDQKEIERAAIKRERARTNEIKSIVRGVGLDDEKADEFIKSDKSIAVVRKEVLDQMIERNPAVGTTPGGEMHGHHIVTRTDGDESMMRAMGDGLIARAVSAAGSKSNPFEGSRPAPGHEDFVNMSLSRMAERYVQRMFGANTARMTGRDIAMIAQNHRPTIERMQRNGLIKRDYGAYHTTGSFSSLMLDAANKSLLVGYEEATFTWNRWARQAPSVADFKPVNRVRFSESPSLKAVAENNPYPEGKMSDDRESYKVEKYGEVFTVSWETIVNDDLDAISRIPQLHGTAARRTQNELVYDVLAANAALRDGNALFSSAHGNDATTTAAPSVSTLNTAFIAMMSQKGLNSDVYINVQPQFLLCPVALAADAMQLLGSIADPSVGGSVAGNSNTLNIYGPNGERRGLELVVDIQLDRNDSGMWYLAAANGSIDTIELAFLQGEESPVMETEWDFDRDCYKYKVRQTMGVKAIDYRGLYRNAG